MKTIKILKIFTFPIIILVIHSIFVLLDAYEIYSWLDLLMHFFGGLAIAASYVSLLRSIHHRSLEEMPGILFFLFIISLVALTAVLWEFLEFILDLMFNLRAQPDLTDTIIDLFLGLVGGICGYFIMKHQHRHVNEIVEK